MAPHQFRNLSEIHRIEIAERCYRRGRQVIPSRSEWAELPARPWLGPQEPPPTRQAIERRQASQLSAWLLVVALGWMSAVLIYAIRNSQ